MDRYPIILTDLRTDNIWAGYVEFDPKESYAAQLADILNSYTHYDFMAHMIGVDTIEDISSTITEILEEGGEL